MRRLGYDRFGGPEVLSWSDGPMPVPGRHDVLVETRASSINPNDIKFRRGRFRVRTLRLARPYGMGLDVAGLVTAVGDQVTRFSAGDRVVGRTKSGDGFAEATIARDRDLVSIPSSIDYPEAAALALSGGTAVGVADAIRLPSGASVFVSGGSGGIGRVLIPLLLRRGLEIEASASSESAERLHALGVRQSHDYRNLDGSSLNGRFDAVIDVSGHLGISSATRLLQARGAFYALVPTGALILPMIVGKVPSTIRPTVHVPLISATSERIGHALALTASHQLSALPDQTYPLREAISAITQVEHNRSLGKTVLTA